MTRRPGADRFFAKHGGADLPTPKNSGVPYLVRMPVEAAAKSTGPSFDLPQVGAALKF
jgi:hypothetical protein